MLEMGESSQELWLRLVDLNLKLNNPDKALRLTQRGPDDLSFALGAGTLFVDQGYYKHAEKVFLPLLKSQPQADEVYFYLALLAFKGDNDPIKATKLLEKVTFNNKFYSRALRFRSHLLYESGKKQEAIDAAREGRELFPDQQEFWTLGASLYEDSGDFDKALQLLTEALQNWPDDSELLYLKGIILDKMSRKVEAFSLMEDLISRFPEHADALNYVGYSLAEQNRDLDRAYALVHKALQLKPQNGYIRDSLAWILFIRGEKQQAWAEIRQAVKDTETDPIIWEHYGDIAADQGNPQEARKGYSKALKLRPANIDALQKKLEAL